MHSEIVELFNHINQAINSILIGKVQTEKRKSCFFSLSWSFARSYYSHISHFAILWRWNWKMFNHDTWQSIWENWKSEKSRCRMCFELEFSHFKCKSVQWFLFTTHSFAFMFNVHVYQHHGAKKHCTDLRKINR